MTSEERDATILSLAGVVIGEARKRFHPATRLALDDLISAGWLGAIAAVDNFDPSRNVPLQLYAKHRIGGAIRDFLRGLDPLSRGHRRELRELGAEAPRTISLDTPVTRDSDNTLARKLADPRALGDFERFEGQRDAKQRVVSILDRARPKQRYLTILERWLDGERMAAIGRSHGIQESRVSQICRRTIARLRAAA
jgi:RNA polymerase sigma factor (sigma-70 family)